MKKALFTLCLFFLISAGAALSQSTLGTGALSAQPVQIQMPSHPEHATQHALASETSLLGSSDYAYAQGERPLWEFGPATQPAPLGDVARAYRAEKASRPTRKPAIVFEKQGS